MATGGTYANGAYAEIALGPGGCAALNAFRTRFSKNELTSLNMRQHAGEHNFSEKEIVRIAKFGQNHAKHVFTWVFEGKNILGWNIGVMFAAAPAMFAAEPFIDRAAVVYNTALQLDNFWITFEATGEGYKCYHCGPLHPGTLPVKRAVEPL